MPHPMFWIVFVVIDAVILYAVLRRVFREASGQALSVLGMSLTQIAHFSTNTNAEVGRYLEANYGGDPAQLPRVMQGLVEATRARAEQEGLRLDDGVIRRLVETAVLQHKVAEADQVRAALDRAA